MRAFYFIALSLLVHVNVYAEDRVLGEDRDKAKLTINKDYQCANEAQVKIVTSTAAYFDEDASIFINYADVARAMLLYECSNLKKIEFVGYTDNTPVFKADASLNNQWQFETEPPPLEWLALYYGLNYEPEFLHLGTVNEQLKPYRKVTGITDSYQFKAYEKQIKRLISVVDGDTEKFKEYLKNGGKEFKSFENALKHYDNILQTIKDYVPDQYPAYKNVYKEVANKLKNDYWSVKAVALVEDYEAPTSQVISNANELINNTSSSEFITFLDNFIADWLIEEANYIKLDLEDAPLHEVEYASEFIENLPDPSAATKFTKTQTLLQSIPKEIIPLIEHRISQLQLLANEIIQNIGDNYQDVDTILETGFALAQDFEYAGYNAQGDAMLANTTNRINSILKAGLPAFREELNSIELTGENVSTLQEQALTFSDLSSEIDGFSAYEKAVEEKLDVNKRSICVNGLREAGINKYHFNKRIYLGNDQVTLTQLACQLNENHHAINEFQWTTWKPGIYTLGIKDKDGINTRFRFKSENIITGQNLHIQDILNDDETPISENEWQEFIAKLLLPPPNGKPDTSGVRECDRLAADPHDPKKLADGTDFEIEDGSLDTFDYDRAIDACIAAIEDDPEDIRQQYQLGRLLWYVGDQETASEYIKLASSANYAPALYYEAEILLNSSDNMNAFVDARDLYLASGEAGYIKGTAKAKELDPDNSFFKEIPAPTNNDLLKSFNSSSVAMFGMSISESTKKIQIKNCFQTSATDFSCEYLKTPECKIGGSGHMAMVFRFVNRFSNACKGARLGFGSFRKLENGNWKALPGQF